MYLSVMDLCTQTSCLYSIRTPQAGTVWYDDESRRCRPYLGQCCIYVGKFSMGGRGIKTDIPHNMGGCAEAECFNVYVGYQVGGEI